VRGKTLDFDLQPKKVEEQNDQGGYDVFWRIGIVSTLYAFEPESEAIGVTEAAQNAARTTYSVMKASITGLVDVVTGAISSCNLSGPIGIAETSGQMARQGGDSLIWFIAVLSTAVGLINLFPHSCFGRWPFGFPWLRGCHRASAEFARDECNDDGGFGNCAQLYDFRAL
jgi:regulator of sigma E protease